MRYPTGIYIRGKQCKINLGNQDGSTVIFAGDRLKKEKLQFAKLLGMNPYRVRVMTEGSSFVCDELKKYTLIIPVSEEDLKGCNLEGIYKDTKKELAKGMSMTVQDAKRIVEKHGGSCELEPISKERRTDKNRKCYRY